MAGIVSNRATSNQDTADYIQPAEDLIISSFSLNSYIREVIFNCVCCS